MKKKTPEFYKERAKEREETRKILPVEKQLEYPIERPERKVAVPAKEILKLRKSEEAQDKYLIESIRQRVKKKLNKDIKEEDIERLEKLKELAEQEREKLIFDLNTIILYEKGINDSNSDVREGTAQLLGELAKVAPEKAIPLYEKGINDSDSDVRRATARSLGELAKVAPEKYIPLYEKGINDSDSSVRYATAQSLGELAKVAPEKAIPLYEKGINDSNSDVRRATAQSLGELAKVAPEKYIPLYEKGINDSDSSVRYATAQSLGELAKTRNFKEEKKIEKILKDKYKIPETEIIYAYQIIVNLLKENKDLSEFVLKYIPEQKSIKEFSREINSELTEDKKTEDIEKFWQKNQVILANLQTFDLNLSTQLIRQNLRLFGFPRLERFLKAASLVLFNPEDRNNLRKITKQLKDIDAESFSRLINLTDAFSRMNLKEEFSKEIEDILSKKELTSKELIKQLGKKLLTKFAEKLDIKPETIQTDIDKWNLEYLSKLFEAEKQFKEEDNELLKLITKLEFQEKDFKQALIGNYQGKYNEEEKEWLKEIEKYTRKIQKEFQEKGIDFDKWFNYEKTKEFRIGSSPETQAKRKESFTKELQEVVINLLGSYREKKEGLLSQDRAKEVFNKAFKKYDIQFREGEFYHPQKGKLDLKDIEPILTDFINLIEQFYQQEAEQRTKEQIGTNLSHLQDLKARLPELSKELEKRGYYLSISPWQRNPGYDIFQGNYTHCCIAVENFNRGAILDYLIDAGMQVIEIKDKTENRTIAQTFIYFAEDSYGKINLILDNVEVNSDYFGLSDEIRKNLFEYLEDYSLDVCPKTKRILLGTAYNDIETSNLEKINVTIRKIGGSPRETEYLDAFGSAWVDPDKETNKTLYLVTEDFKRKEMVREKRLVHKYITQLIEEIDKEVLRAISEVEKASFPEEMQSDIEDLRETLENKEGIQLITKNEKGEIVSYLSSKPLKDAYKDLKNYDPELKPEKDTLYVESIATKPENRDVRIFLRTLNTLKEKAREKGYKKIAAHARVQNNLSDLLQKRGAKKLRTIDNWHDFGEPFDYLEIEI